MSAVVAMGASLICSKRPFFGSYRVWGVSLLKRMGCHRLMLQLECLQIRPKKRNCLFPVTVRKNRVGRSVKKIFLQYFLGQKCVFYACFLLIGSWEGEKNLRVGIFFLNKNLLG